MRVCACRRNKHWLGQVKHGCKAMYPFGRAIAEQLPSSVDAVVSCLGAGVTFEGLQIAVQDHFHERGIAKPRIVIAEHAYSPLFARLFPDRLRAPPALYIGLDRDISRTVSELPHPVIGPHYDEINPFISPEALERIDDVIQYDNREWKAMQQHLERQGISVGNSSAANVSIATRMASE